MKKVDHPSSLNRNFILFGKFCIYRSSENRELVDRKLELRTELCDLSIKSHQNDHRQKKIIASKS